MKTSVIIAGTGDVTYENASALLADWLTDAHKIYLPSRVNTDGLKNAVRYLDESKTPYERLSKSDMVDELKDLYHEEGTDVILILLGNDGSPANELYYEAVAKSIPTLDLCKGLFDAQVPLDGPESKSEAVADDPGTGVTPQVTEAAQKFSEPDDDAPAFTNQKQFFTLIRLYVQQEIEAHMSDYHQRQVISGQMKTLPAPAETEKTPEPSGIQEAFYKNKSGKLRRAGKTKKRPSEEEVFLSEEEVKEWENDTSSV